MPQLFLSVYAPAIKIDHVIVILAGYPTGVDWDRTQWAVISQSPRWVWLM